MTQKIILSAALVLSLASCSPEIDGYQPAPVVNQPSQPEEGIIVHEFMINGSPTYVNEVNGEYWFSEDISITQEQFEQLRQQADPESRSLFTKSLSKVWPKGVVYYRMPEQGTLNAGNYKVFLDNVKKAFNLISSKTRITFVQQTNQKEYIYFTYANGNSSPLGWSQGKANQIRMYNINSVGIIAHEILHSLGVYHEQSRPDRDKYIIVYPERIAPANRFNYNISWSAQMSGTFDFNSLMLYSSDGFAINPKVPCMTKLDGSWIHGQRRGLSEGDYVGLNELYNTSVTGQDQKPEPKPDVKPEPKPEPEPGATTWDSNKAYKAGDRVVYNGSTYEAKWWTKGNVPSSSDAWKLISPNAVAVWDSNKAYTGGTIVVHNGKKYKAKWWTRGDEPGRAGVWQAI
jgi:chitodextrinase